MRSAPPRMIRIALTLLIVCVPAASVSAGANAQEDSARISPPVRRFLYVAEPGIRDYLEYGGHGLLVFDIDNGHTFVKRIPTAGLDAAGKPLNVKGVCANAATKKIYVSTTQQLMCLDLVTEKLLWEKKFDRGCDRMSMTPDGALIFLPSFEGPLWYVLRASDGEELARITPDSGAHNTVAGLNGKEAYLAGLKSPLLTVADTAAHRAIRTVGPFSASIRPFTVNGRQTLCFVNVNELLGFEVGDLVSGQKLHRVDVKGFSKGPTKRHGCPSHGIGLTPDEKELWLTDSFNTRVHIFDATVMPPVQVASIVVRDEPGWVTFSIDGRYAYPSTGDVIDTRTRKIVTLLKDELVRNVQSEKMVEIDFKGTQPVSVGDQFGLGRVRP
jgi:DNA-binding beta-propeller fold protein YncE